MCLLFIGLGALGGGGLLALDPTGSRMQIPQEWLARSIFPDFLVPGLFLFLVFGVGSLALLYALWFRPRWSWLASLMRWTHEHWVWGLTALFGLALVLWILIQLVVIQRYHPLQPVIAGVGILIVLLDALPDVRRYYHQ